MLSKNLKLNQKYSPRERALVMHLIQHNTSAIDVIAEAVQKDCGKPISTKNATAIIKSASSKLPLDKLRIVRNSPLGRGNRGLYTIESLK